AWKCTFCYDRLGEGLTPACAKACPTESIQFGALAELQERARRRVDQLHGRGLTAAYLYGADAADQPGTEGLHAFFLLVDRPATGPTPRTTTGPCSRSRGGSGRSPPTSSWAARPAPRRGWRPSPGPATATVRCRGSCAGRRRWARVARSWAPGCSCTTSAAR